MDTLDKVDLALRFALIEAPWSPRIVAALNGQEVKIVKCLGAFPWHSHPEADELFLVIAGRLRMDLREGPVFLEPGELLVVPRGVEHRPVAEAEVRVLLFEPEGTRNTGDRVNEFTVDREGRRLWASAVPPEDPDRGGAGPASVWPDSV